MRRTKEEAWVTREQILQAALRVFRRKGYTASTLEEIAQEAGVTRGAVYGHFQGKPELYETVIVEGFVRSEVAFQDLFSEHGAIEHTLRRFMLRSLAAVEDDEWYQGVIELTLFQAEPGRPSAGNLADKQQGTQALVGTLVKLLNEGIEQGEVKEGIDAQAVALTLIASVNGAILLWFQSQRTFSLKGFADTLADTFLRGILACR